MARVSVRNRRDRAPYFSGLTPAPPWVVPSLTAAVCETLADEARHPGDGAEFAERVLGAVRRVVGYDGYCLFGVDPVTGLRSSMFSRQGLDGVADRLAHNESVERDANRYADLAAARRPVGLLGLDGGRNRSPRLHELVRPAGFSAELRLALRGPGRYWGALVLFRSGAFAEADADAALGIAEPLALAVRSYPERRTTTTPTSRPPGLVVLDADNQVVPASPQARVWLEDACPGGADEVAPEDVLRVVHDVGHAARRGERTTSLVRTTDGRWLLVSSERLEPGSGTVDVVLAAAALGDVLPAASAWFGFTGRERDVVGLAARGPPAKQIARRLEVSLLTVNGHLGAAYRKAGVTGREELLARLS